MTRHYPVAHIVFSSANRMWIIVPGALIDPFTGTYWTHFWNNRAYSRYGVMKRCLRFFRRRTDYFFVGVPDFVVVDRNDLLIMAKDEGEWGSQFYYFDTRRERPLKPSDTVAGLWAMNPEGLFLNERGETIACAPCPYNDKNRHSGIYKLIDHQQMITYPSPRSNVDYFNRMEDEKTSYVYLSNPYAVSWPRATFNQSDRCVYSLHSTGTGAEIRRSRILGDSSVTDGERVLEVYRPIRYHQNKLFASGRYFIWITEANGLGVYDTKSKEIIYMK